MSIPIHIRIFDLVWGVGLTFLSEWCETGCMVEMKSVLQKQVVGVVTIFAIAVLFLWVLPMAHFFTVSSPVQYTATTSDFVTADSDEELDVEKTVRYTDLNEDARSDFETLRNGDELVYQKGEVPTQFRDDSGLDYSIAVALDDGSKYVVEIDSSNVAANHFGFAFLLSLLFGMVGVLVSLLTGIVMNEVFDIKIYPFKLMKDP